MNPNEKLKPLLSAFHRSRSIADRNRLAEHCGPWLRRRALVMCKRFHGRIEFWDLYQAGAVALLNAIESHNPDKGGFLAHAFTRVVGSMLDLARKRDHLKRKQRDAVKRGEATAPAVMSLEDLGILNNDCTLADVLADNSPHPGKSLADRDAATRVLRVLNPQASRAMKLYFLKDLALKAAGKRLGLSESRMSQIVCDSLALLRAEFGGQLELVG